MFWSRSKICLPGHSASSVSVHGCQLRIGMSQLYRLLPPAPQVPAPPRLVFVMVEVVMAVAIEARDLHGLPVLAFALWGRKQE